LGHNVGSLHLLLDDLTSLARLQAGQEQRKVAPFDAAAELLRLCSDLRPLAESKGLYLESRGPDALPVEGDAVKVRRIAQNLLLNALKYTRTGGVTMTWHDGVPGDRRRWRFSVEDTGPGFHAGPGAPLVHALDASAPVQPVKGAAAPDATVISPGDLDQRPIMQSKGEGLGLAIVKRLCDLLDANVRFEAVGSGGTRVQVTLPHDYPDTSATPH
jgi:signal transduction histidine kinase